MLSVSVYDTSAGVVASTTPLDEDHILQVERVVSSHLPPLHADAADERITLVVDLCESSKHIFWTAQFCNLDCTFCFLDCTKLVGLHR